MIWPLFSLQLLGCNQQPEKNDSIETTTDTSTIEEGDIDSDVGFDIQEGVWLLHDLGLTNNGCEGFEMPDEPEGFPMGVILEGDELSLSLAFDEQEPAIDCSRSGNEFSCLLGEGAFAPIMISHVLAGQFQDASSIEIEYRNEFSCLDGQEAECEDALAEGAPPVPCEVAYVGAGLYCGANVDQLSEECLAIVEGDDEPDDEPHDECGLSWPDDPFHAAVYSFIAEYALQLGAIVGCFLDGYPDQTYEAVATELEDTWTVQSGTGAQAVEFAQEWVNTNAAGLGEEPFELVEVFDLVVNGSSVTGGLGFSESESEVECIELGNEDTSNPVDSPFEILENPHIDAPGMKCLSRYVDVLGLSVYAESALTNAQIIHAASVLAELLDNDEDGVVDDQVLYNQLLSVDAMVPIFNAEGSPAYDDFAAHYHGQGVSAVLFANEVDPAQPGKWGYDASVEEIMHTINHRGHVTVYPEAFDIAPDSSLLTAAMDVARGGQFLSVPSSYPEEAWYHYDDTTCDYGCMAIEYMYWAQVSNMGILDDPQTCAGIANEWQPCSPDLLASMDVLVYALITDPQYLLPQSAPDGVYAPSAE